jgi:hypothetical protein
MTTISTSTSFPLNCNDESEESDSHIRIILLIVGVISGVCALVSTYACMKRRIEDKRVLPNIEINIHTKNFYKLTNVLNINFLKYLNKIDISNYNLTQLPICNNFKCDKSICIMNNTQSDRIMLLCKHTFHKECILDKIRQGNNTCPICRKTIIL